MTYEEAIKNINALNAVCGQKDFYDAEFESALALAIDALEKQIPKKPAMGKYGHTECACCGWVVESFCGDLEQYPFCPNCGARMDGGSYAKAD